MSFNFSYTQEKYDEFTEHGRRYLTWTNKEETWNYKDCSITVLGHKDGVHIVLRRERSGKSKLKKSNYILKLMMGFTAIDVQKNYTDSKYELKFIIQQTLDKNHRDLKDVKIWSSDKDSIENLHQTIQEKMKTTQTGNIIAPNSKTNTELIPVIYQPRIDAWKNFLREINVHKKDNVYEVTLAFEGEVLRKFFLVDIFYKIYRFFKYKRTRDIETFEIRENQFYFENIYSDNDTLFDDSTHNKKIIPIKYYFSNNNHPIIFINTSNHAMAPHDNNHDFWKWEYIPWSDTTPIECGEKPKRKLKNYTGDSNE
ncbi:MAG: hypothetical protein MJK05_03355 [Nitrosopumilus sp.]|nr:hypothetical protein [Nitrosopumilus sp.]